MVRSCSFVLDKNLQNLNSISQNGGNLNCNILTWHHSSITVGPLQLLFPQLSGYTDLKKNVLRYVTTYVCINALVAASATRAGRFCCLVSCIFEFSQWEN